MIPIPEEHEIVFEYELDPNKPLVLLLGWVDHEGILSSLKTSGQQYKKKILTSMPDNWAATTELFNQFQISSVLGKLPAEVLGLIVDDAYRDVSDRLFTAVGTVPNQIYLFEDILVGEQQDKFHTDYRPYPDRATLDAALAFLKVRNVQIIPYVRKADVTVLADAFIDETDRNLIYRLYVPTGRLWSGEADRILQLFQDYLTRVEKLQVRLNQKRTEHGVVYEFHGHPPTGQTSLEPDFKQFSALLTLLQDNAHAAEAFLETKGANSSEITKVVTRYSKEARRLHLDIKHELESKAVSIRHRLESELLDLNPTQEDWRLISQFVERTLPSVGEPETLGFIHLGRPSARANPTTLNVTYNYQPKFIEAVNSVIAEEVNGNQHFSPEHHQLLDLVNQLGGEKAKELETAVYEIADGGLEKVDRLKATQKLKAFLIEVGKKTGDVAFGILQSYIEKQLGL